MSKGCKGTKILTGFGLVITEYFLIWMEILKLQMFYQGVQLIKIERGFNMTATRQQLRDIIDIVDSNELNVLYQVLIKFIVN